MSVLSSESSTYLSTDLSLRTNGSFQPQMSQTRNRKDTFTLDIDINVAQLHNVDPLSLKVAIRTKTLFLKGP